MRILVLGNGFDVEHKLKTSYIDFLKFSSWLIDTFEKKEPGTYRGEVFYSKNYDELKKLRPQIILELYKDIKDNLWINYFNRVNEKIGKNWIDFESEISNVVQVFEKARNEYIEKAEFYTSKIKSTSCFKNFQAVLYGTTNTEYSVSGKDFDEIYESMHKDLNRVIRALEIYLSYWVEKTDIITMNPDVVGIRPNRIISFNYTHTFDRVYGKSDYGMEYCYIHGETNANSNLDECEMVLGIDDYNKRIKTGDGEYLIAFKKYYQRLVKECSTIYKKWIEEIRKNKDEKHELFIFGHSLDVTDKEILEPIIMLDNVTTTIFCHNKGKRSELIANLIKMCGKEPIIRKMYEGSVIFRIQSKSREIHDSELEVKTDVQKIYHIGNLSFCEIEELVRKIENKISTEDCGYFNMLTYVVDVVDALDSRNLWNPSLDKNIKGIVRKMVDSCADIIELLDSSEWIDFDYTGSIFTRPITLELVNYVNSLVIKKTKMAGELEQKLNPTEKSYEEMNDSDYESMYIQAFNCCVEKGYFDTKVTDLLSIYINNNIKAAKKAYEGIKSVNCDVEEKTDIWRVFVAKIDDLIWDAMIGLQQQPQEITLE